MSSLTVSVIELLAMAASVEGPLLLVYVTKKVHGEKRTLLNNQVQTLMTNSVIFWDPESVPSLWAAPAMWNKVLPEIQKAPILIAFRKALKTWPCRMHVTPPLLIRGDLYCFLFLLTLSMLPLYYFFVFLCVCLIFIAMLCS